MVKSIESRRPSCFISTEPKEIFFLLSKEGTNPETKEKKIIKRDNDNRTISNPAEN